MPSGNPLDNPGFEPECEEGTATNWTSEGKTVDVVDQFNMIKAESAPLPSTPVAGNNAPDGCVSWCCCITNDGENMNNSCHNEEEEDYSLCSYCPSWCTLWKYHLRKKLRKILLTFAAVGYVIYFIAVLTVSKDIQEVNEEYWCNGPGFLIIITITGFLGILYFKVFKQLGKRLMKKSGHSENRFQLMWKYRVVRGIVYTALLLALVIFLAIDSSDDPSRLVSLVGLACLLLFGFIFSAAPRKIVWRHIIWGLALQFLLGMMILRWPIGKEIFQCAGNKVRSFLHFTDKGSTFVFGSLVIPDHIFAFKILTVIFFFSFCIQILYYLGVMQWIVIKFGWLLQVTIGTTACESVTAAANIFLGMSEAPLMIKPMLPQMTKSEIHAIMTGGFATIAGSALAAFISFNISASHLLSASIMSAPAALAFSKLFYPETETSCTNAKDIHVEKSKEVNILHAAIVGVANAIPLVAHIIANLIAFIAFIAFFNSVFDWTCQLLTYEEGTCSLENLFGYIFMPLAWTMGVQWSECLLVGKLIGIKTIINEFVAYTLLAEWQKKNLLSARAEIIATYALCGFSNIGSIGIQLGALGALAPSRKADIARVAVRAMIAGSAACFLTACIAGILLTETNTVIHILHNATLANITSVITN